MENVVSVVLTDVQQADDSITVMREMTLDDGSVVSGKHVFPVDTLEWRAAEYGLDPEDVDTLLDIVIHEPFLGDPDEPEMLLYDAPTIDEAREYHLARIERVKGRVGQPKMKKAGPDLVREKIKQLVVINPEAIQLKQEFVHRGRAIAHREREGKAKAGLRALFVQPVDPEAERIKRLKSTLSPKRPTATLQGVEE